MKSERVKIEVKEPFEFGGLSTPHTRKIVPVCLCCVCVCVSCGFAWAFCNSHKPTPKDSCALLCEGGVL